MERTIEEVRRIRHERLASDEPGIAVQRGTAMVVFFSICFAVPLSVALVCLILGSQQLLNVALMAGLAAVVAVRPLLVIIVDGIRGRSLTRRVRKTVGPELPAGAHAVCFGLHLQSRSAASPWDEAPLKEGAIAVTAGGLELRSSSDASVLPLAEVLGVVLTPGRRFAPDRLDIHLRSGEAIEVSTTQPRALGADMSAAGMRVLQEFG
ncbi:hypothetical protein [Streptomyces sporangiiformans]|uniref:Uncharacterized protein n=1 Tax=Streptomyces sporangiiformans TaxID=2315329 RepID=A0A505DLD2_9ACTN|nr:hypothetical protein [Streptomyces sporangiiformans]TPQ20229.1 hypothetical protein FGD71_021425 [Streptomyces sporangiiformans]